LLVIFGALTEVAIILLVVPHAALGERPRHFQFFVSSGDSSA
jgi:hypothetical protein